MDKLFATIRKIIIMALVMVSLFTSAVSYVYWYGETKSKDSISFLVGIADNLFGDDVDPGDPFSRFPQYQYLPEGTTKDVLYGDDEDNSLIDRLEEILVDSSIPNSQEVVEKLIDALLPIIDDLVVTGMTGLENDASFNGIMIGESWESLFDHYSSEGSWNNPPKGNFLVFMDGDDVRIIYVNPDSTYPLTKDNLDQALQYHWNRINEITVMHSPGNTYTLWTAPITDENGRSYLLWNGGYNGGVPSSNGAWFEITYGYTFLQSNINAYYEGRIVNHNGQWYIARQNAWQAPTANPQPWEPWGLIPDWSQGSYSVGSVVRAGGNRFFRALRNTTAVPNEANTRNGEWLEINNGWIGAGLGNIIRSHYLPHNTFRAGDIVIYGISARHNYRYFRAVKDVPPDQHPIISEKNVTRVNSEFWSPINN